MADNTLVSKDSSGVIGGTGIFDNLRTDGSAFFKGVVTFRDSSNNGILTNEVGEEVHLSKSSNEVRFKVTGSTRFAMGSNKFYPLVDNGYNCGVPGNRWSVVYSALGVNTSSSSEVKKEVEDECCGIDFIKKLRPVKYRYKNQDENSNHSRGFIAQEIEKIDCEFCEKNVLENGEYDYGINYANFISPLVKAFQEAITRIEELETNVNNLQQENQDLKKK